MTLQGLETIFANLDSHAARVQVAGKAIFEIYKPVLENYAKTHARWTDRTANARQGLHSDIVELSNDTVALYIAHGMEYGVFLETKYQGRYAILWESIEAVQPQVLSKLRQIF